VADLAEHRITCANAGHPNPLVLHRENGIVDWLRTDRQRKPPLGMLDGMTYPSFDLPLVLLPDAVWTQFPYGLTMEGQYIIKNLVLIGAGLVLGGTVRGGRLRPEPD